MFEILMVAGIVAIALFMMGRSFYRTITGKNDGCGCTGNCHNCSSNMFEITDKDKDTNQ